MSDVTFKSQVGDGLLYGACAWLSVQQLSVQIANTAHGCSGSSTSFIEPGAVISSVASL